MHTNICRIVVIIEALSRLSEAEAGGITSSEAAPSVGVQRIGQHLHQGTTVTVL